MPIEVGKVVNSTAERLTQNKIIRGIARNPFYTALVIAFLVVLIAAWNFRGASKNYWTSAARMFIYTTAAMTAVMFLHNHVLIGEVEKNVVAGGNDLFADQYVGGIDAPMSLDINDYLE